MDFKHKLNIVKDFFKGKDPNVNPIHYMPVKTLFWFPADPEHYVDAQDKSKIYSMEEVEELGKKFCLVIIQILKSAEDIAFAKEWDRKEELEEKRLANLESGISE